MSDAYCRLLASRAFARRIPCTLRLRSQHLVTILGHNTWSQHLVRSLQPPGWFCCRYSKLAANGQVLSEAEVHIVGVIAGRRDFSKKLAFLELGQGSGPGSERMQVVLNHKVRSRTWALPLRRRK